MTQLSPYSGIYRVAGPPGCGKTTFLARQIEAVLEKTHTAFGRLHDSPVLVCSLTRTAAGEVVHKCGEMEVPIHPRCIGTLHAHAYRALDCPDVIDAAALTEWNGDHPQYAIGGATPDPDEPDWEDAPTQRGPGDDTRELYEVLRARRTPRRLYPPHVEAFADRWEAWKRDTERIDFSDMIEQALTHVDTAPGAPAVLIADEAQDLSALEYALLHKWAEQAEALIVAGDAYQSLYVWRGAEPGMLMPDDTEAGHYRILAQSYRVPVAVHGLATRWIAQVSGYTPIDYKPRDAPGRVRTIDACSQEPARMIDEVGEILDTVNDRGEPATVMIAASCSYLLQPIVNACRAAGLPFANPWRTRRGDWNPLGGGSGVTMAQRLTDLLAFDPNMHDPPRWWTWGELWRWVYAAKAEGILFRGAKKAIGQRAELTPDDTAHPAELWDLFEPVALDRLMKWRTMRGEVPPATDLGWLCRWYGSRMTAAKQKASRYPLRLLADHGPDILTEAPRLYIGTIHSFKGAEADHVYLMPDLSPAGWREWGDETRGGRDSVIRTFYVGMTRARQELILCEPSGGRSVDWAGLHDPAA